MSMPRDADGERGAGGEPGGGSSGGSSGGEPGGGSSGGEPSVGPGAEPGGVPGGGPSSAKPEQSRQHDPGRRLTGGHEPGNLVLGRYRLRELVGSGASADVWLAQDERLNRPIALKLLHPHLLPDAASRERFAAEARAVASVSHPGIVGIHDVVIEGRTAAIVFEYVRGESLDARLRRVGRFPPIEAAEIAAQLAEALAAAHAAGLVHRDVKPGNVLLDASGRARLVDFGIAQVLGEARARLTRQGEVVGTLRSIAPEQLSGYAGAPAADLYALGTVLYEMLAGRPPYDATTPVALAEQQRRPPPPIPDAPAGLAALVLRCLQPDPAARPASATEVAGYLRGWLAAASPASAPSDVRLPATPPLPPAAPPAAPSRNVVPSGSGLRGGPSALRSAPLSPAFDPNATTLTGSRRRSRARRAGLAGLFLALALASGMATWPLIAALSAGPTPSPSGIAAGQSAGESSTATPPAPTDSATPEATDTATPEPIDTPTQEPTDTPTPEPTDTPTPEPTDTPTPLPDSLVIVSPEDGATVNKREVTVEGLAPPGAQVVRDMPMWFDVQTQADGNGHWRMKVTLDPGTNSLAFRIGNDRSTEQTITIYYQH